MTANCEARPGRRGTCSVAGMLDLERPHRPDVRRRLHHRREARRRRDGRGLPRRRGNGMDRSVAIKILHPTLGDRDHGAARFEREATMAAQIDHPNVVRVIEHGDRGRPPVHRDGAGERARSVRGALPRSGGLAPGRAASIALQICDAVATAHEGGIIHRDSEARERDARGRPSSPGGERVKLLDFGVAKQLHALRRAATGRSSRWPARSWARPRTCPPSSAWASRSTRDRTWRLRRGALSTWSPAARRSRTIARSRRWCVTCARSRGRRR